MYNRSPVELLEKRLSIVVNGCVQEEEKNYVHVEEENDGELIDRSHEYLVASFPPSKLLIYR